VANDIDPVETEEWLEAMDALVRHGGKERATYVFLEVAKRLYEKQVDLPTAITTPFRNTIHFTEEKRLPGDLFMERRIRSLIRWNAMAMVMRANKNDEGLGGHIATFSSAATLYDVGYNHFFRGNNFVRADGVKQLGDLVYFQGHSAPGMYARSYLEGILNERHLDNFRREVDGYGLSSYPHPWLMPDYWQFPTVSMGLGPIQAIYQAHVMKYQSKRGLVDHGDRKVWAFLGDGECDEPESLGSIGLAGREKLDNLIFVVNCNLQRLDGPVRGNGKIIQELEGVFRGAGWNVVKVVWGRLWDALLERDKTGLLQKRMDEVCDGELQNCKANGGAYTREHFFGKYPELLELVKDLSDKDIMYLNRGGHDPYKMFAAYDHAVNHVGQPTVILAMTVKGYGMGSAGEAANDTHSTKKLDLDSLKKFRDRFDIPIPDDQLEKLPYYRPAPDSPEMKYMHEKRDKLGGAIPVRLRMCETINTPDLKSFDAYMQSSGDRSISTTMAFVRILSALVKDKEIGQRVVPIVPDEARTFGMEGMFRQLGIYSSIGQKYTPVDANQIMYYKESEQGQILEEGINEAGAFSAWLACGTSYSTHQLPMIPFYIFYSMFGFQRIGDLAWAAGDSQARGFLIGATAGRTTLNGEGLQHQDGHSHILASTIPNCVTYDPTYGYELAVIIQNGLERMFQRRENCFYYITTMNENYPQPGLPGDRRDEIEQGIIKGMYLLHPAQQKNKLLVQLMGCGTILREVEAAAEMLRTQFGVESDVWSMTSINELRRDGLETSRWNRLHPQEKPRPAYVTQQLQQRFDAGYQGPVIVATDYIKLFGDQLREFIPASYTVLGTDGFGRSDTRAKLRRHFEVDRYHVVTSALHALMREGKVAAQTVQDAITHFGISPEKSNPVRM
jgi:pyruvate dehydrogenase E1 component